MGNDREDRRLDSRNPGELGPQGGFLIDHPGGDVAVCQEFITILIPNIM